MVSGIGGEELEAAAAYACGEGMRAGRAEDRCCAEGRALVAPNAGGVGRGELLSSERVLEARYVGYGGGILERDNVALTVFGFPWSCERRVARFMIVKSVLAAYRCS